MAKPLIYISYGMPKSGSTLAYRLISAILSAAGDEQLPLPGFASNAGVNYAKVINPATLAQLTNGVTTTNAGLTAVKTHCGLWNCVTKGLNQGWLAAHAICRDPRDIALSMLDAGRNDRAWGKRNGIPLTNFDDALAAVRGHADKFEGWAAHPAVLTLDYETLAFNTERAAKLVAEQLRIDIDAKACAKAAQSAPTQRNKVASDRWRTELTPEQNIRAVKAFGDFIHDHIST
ncbi:MAG: hypothetical protein ACPGGK_04025 [Pikeienuella sp.]